MTIITIPGNNGKITANLQGPLIINKTNYSVTYTKNITNNAVQDAIEYRTNYTGTNNLYIVDKAIQSSGSNLSLTAHNMQTGDDITDYMLMTFLRLKIKISI